MEIYRGPMGDLRASGLLTFITPDGPITLEINQARVVGGIPSLTPDTLSFARDRFHRLGDFLQQLPNGKTTDNWVREREDSIVNLGDESLMGMIPANIGRSTKFLSRFFHSLSRAGIKTKEDLISLSDRKLSLIQDAGAMSFRFGKILREAIQAEKLLKQNQTIL